MPILYDTFRGLTAKPPMPSEYRWPVGVSCGRFVSVHRLVDLVGVRLESGRSRVGIPLAPDFFRGQVMPVTKKLALQWLPCQARYRVSAGTGRPGVSIL